LLAIRQQMSAATVSASESTTSHRVSELQQQLDGHDALMHDLAVCTAQLRDASSHVQDLDTNIAGNTVLLTYVDSLCYCVKDSRDVRK